MFIHLINKNILNMIEDNIDYWVYQDYLIFKPHFNKEINELSLRKYKHIIFSNYKNPLITIKTFNKYIYEYKDFYEFSKFNQPINLPDTIIHLTFGYYFNQPVNLSCSLTYLCFDFNFNQPLNLPNSLEHLSFGNLFNQPINLPNSLKYLNVGSSFNQNINLPTKLKYLCINSNNQYIINNLVDSIEELELGYNFNLELNNLPNNIQRIIFYKYSIYDKNLNSLPDSIEFISLPISYDKKILYIPKSLKQIECFYDYKFLNDYDEKIQINKYKL
jgi:hypothetical protein